MCAGIAEDFSVGGQHANGDGMMIPRLLRSLSSQEKSEERLRLKPGRTDSPERPPSVV